LKRKPGSVGTKHRIDWHEYPVRLEDSTEILKVTVEEMLRNKQIQFDGRIVDAFLKIEKSLNNDSK